MYIFELGYFGMVDRSFFFLQPHVELYSEKYSKIDIYEKLEFVRRSF